MNEKAINYAKKFGNTELLGFFKQAEKDKYYGTLYHHPAKIGTAEFVFQDGVCLRCLEPIRGKENTFNKITKF
jgi:hypothetical protein